MDTADIIQKCRALPGVTVEEGDSYTDLLLSNAGGTGRMRFLPLFPGVTLALISVDAPTWPAPQPDECTPDANGPLIVNYCTRGRCELILNDNKSVFLTSGHISLTEKFARGEYVYPGGTYEGIELFIDPDTAQNGQPMLRDSFGVDLAQLRAKYCPNGETFIAKLPLPDNLSSRRPGFSDAGNPLRRISMQTGVIDLLALLLYGQAPEPEQLVYYTRLQVGIAKQIEAIITKDLSQQHTAREFAERFSISESSVKNYFSGVFGQSISQYATRQRMLRAAELLTSTRLSVIEVANRVGYLNQSKFSTAFRRTHGVSPREYRTSRMLPAELP